MLLTNGCSFVWGDELDGYNDNPPSHFHLTFTHLLAQKLQLDYVNLATCGACNQKIFRDTMHYLNNPELETPTHVVIIWSAFQREEVAENWSEEYEHERPVARFQCMTQIAPARLKNLKPELRKPLDRLYDHYDVTRTGIIRTLTYMETMEMLSKTMGFKLVQGVFHELMWRNMLDKLSPRNRRLGWEPWMDWATETLGRLPDTSRVGMGKAYQDLYGVARERHSIKTYGHPDESAQIEYADMLHGIFKDMQ